MASLFVIQGRDQGKRFEFRDPVIALGRDAQNTIQLHDGEVSRHHAEIRADDAGYSLIDLNSSNGCFINNQQVTQQVLRSGDRLQLGRTLMIFTDVDDASAQLLEEVDIVSRRQESPSRILKTVSHDEGSRILTPGEIVESPWLARARSNLQVMYHTALAVSHTLDIDQLSQRILELIFEWVEADRGCLMLVDAETDALVPKARRNRRGLLSDDKMEISRTILDYVLQQREGVLTSDAREDQRWDAAGSIVKLGVREAICVPMQGRYGIVGVIYVDTYTPPGRFIQRHANKFNEEHLKLMIAIGHQAALAVEDTSYYSAMVQAERLAAMGQTIATLSHHIKNILQGIRGGSYLIEEGLKGNETEIIRKGWRIVEKNQEKISNLVMDMLTFSKERAPEMVPANMNEVAADVVELMQVRAADASVRLEFQPDPGMIELAFDPDAMHRALLNVVTNAIDACEKRADGTVVVQTECDLGAGVVRIVVSDNGEGILPEDLRKIFSVFESRKGSRGTGLGLPVSQKILREHGGDILLESTPQVGSRFTLQLPAVRVAASDRTMSGSD
jgi:signal transduction histidine kinase